MKKAPLEFLIEKKTIFQNQSMNRIMAKQDFRGEERGL